MTKTATLSGIQQWSRNHPVIINILYYLFLPITFPTELLFRHVLRWIAFKAIAQLKEAKDENNIFNVCANYMKFTILMNKWKWNISKKWFVKTMKKKELRLYNHAIDDKQKIDFNYFRTLVEVYNKYDIIGGAVMNDTGDTTIHIE